MPIYEYVCPSCQHRFEVKQSMSDPPVSSCTQCGQAVTKVISASAIMFKGSGWYVTDYSDKLKQTPEPKTEEKSPPIQKQEGESSTSTPSPAGTAAPAAPDSSAKPTGQPATASTDTSSAAPAAPSSSSPK